MTHLSHDDLQAFFQQTTPAERLLELDDHLAACPMCRAALEAAAQPAALHDMQSIFEPHGGHLSFETLRALAEGRVASEEDTIHAVTCALCSSEFTGLKQFATQLIQTPRSKTLTLVPRPISVRPAFYVAMAACLAIAITALYLHQAAPPAPAVTLKDGASQLTIDRSGHLHGAETLSSEDQTLLLTALQSGHIDLHPHATGPRTETILGTKTEQATPTSFAPIAPLSAVLNLRPTFTWKPLPDATTYVVSIYGTGYHKVMESPVLSTTTWRPDDSLQPGTTYTWTITAHTRTGQVREPAPPAAEATFSTGSIDQLASLQEQIRHHNGDHLLSAMLYLRAGEIAEAQQQMDALIAQNPHNALVKSLRESMKQPMELQTKPHRL